MNDNGVGYWNAPCGVDILTVDGTADLLAEHVRGCSACHAKLRESSKRATVRYNDKIMVTPEIAKMLGLDVEP